MIHAQRSSLDRARSPNQRPRCGLQVPSCRLGLLVGVENGANVLAMFRDVQAASDYMKQRQVKSLDSKSEKPGPGYVAAFIDYHSYAEAGEKRLQRASQKWIFGCWIPLSLRSRCLLALARPCCHLGHTQQKRQQGSMVRTRPISRAT